MRFFLYSVLLLVACDAAQVLLSGDSWTGGSRQFIDVFNRYNDPRSIQNIGSGGSTCRGWAQGSLLTRLTSAVRASDVEHVWLICGGNDAVSELLGCTPQAECIERMITNMRSNLKTIISAVRDANPNVKVVGFGYDLFPFGAIHCNILSRGLFPECGGDALCVNNEFFKFQQLYDEMAAEFDNFDSANVLGACQAAEGIEDASIGNPNPNFFSPGNTYAFDCIHPNAYGYDMIFDAFYQEYWSKTSPRSVSNETNVFKDNFEEDAVSQNARDALLWKYYLKGLEMKNATTH